MENMTDIESFFDENMTDVESFFDENNKDNIELYYQIKKYNSDYIRGIIISCACETLKNDDWN